MPTVDETVIEKAFSLQVDFVNLFGNVIFIPMLAFFIVGAALAFDRHKREFLLILLSMFSYPYSIVLKLFFQQERPEGANIFFTSIYDIYGFPSTHTVYYVAFWGYILYLCLRLRHENKYIRLISAVFSTYMIIMVGFARVQVGAHYPKDVIGGYFFGLAYLAFILLVDLSLNKFKTDDNTDYLTISLTKKVRASVKKVESK